MEWWLDVGHDEGVGLKCMLLLWSWCMMWLWNWRGKECVDCIGLDWIGLDEVCCVGEVELEFGVWCAA